VTVDFLPDLPAGWLRSAKRDDARITLRTLLRRSLPDRLAETLSDQLGLRGDLGNIADRSLDAAERRLSDWQFTPNGSEGFAKAEVTIGGISTADLGKIPIELGLMTDTGYPHKGVIDYIAPQVDPSTGTLRLRGVFANPDYGLLPGLFAHVRVSPSQGPEKEELLVPETALGSDQAGRYVLVVDKDNIVDKRSVTVGPALDDLRVVEKGLGPDDRVIVAGLMRAIPGQKVNPETVAGAVAAKRADAAK